MNQDKLTSIEKIAANPVEAGHRRSALRIAWSGVVGLLLDRFLSRSPTFGLEELQMVGGPERTKREEYHARINQAIKSELERRNDPREHDLRVRYSHNKPSKAMQLFEDFAVYFGELYFANNWPKQVRFKHKSGDYVVNDFLTKLLEVSGEKGLGIHSLMGMCATAIGEVEKSGYEKDAQDERIRMLYRAVRGIELHFTGETELAESLKLASILPSLLTDMGHDELRNIRFDTDPTNGMNDQDVTINAFALGQVWSQLPDEYQDLANTGLKLKNATLQIERERQQLGQKLFDFCRVMSDDHPLVVGLSSEANGEDEERASAFWRQFGLELRNLDNSPEIIGVLAKQFGAPTQAWLALVDMDAAGKESGFQYDDLGDKEIVEKAFLFAQQTYLKKFAQDRDLGLYQICKEQMFNPKFTEFMQKNTKGDDAAKWSELMDLWRGHEKTILAKDRLVDQFYRESQRGEYDPDYQTLLTVGMMEYYKQLASEYPVFEELMKTDGLWEEYLILALREISPIGIWVNDETGPLAPHGYTPFNLQGVLRTLEQYVSGLKDLVPDLSVRELLAVTANISPVLELLKHVPVDQQDYYRQLYDEKLHPLSLKLRFGPTSAVQWADKMMLAEELS